MSRLLDSWRHDSAQPGAEEMFDGDVDDELHVSGSFNACHAVPLGLLTDGGMKFMEISPAR